VFVEPDPRKTKDGPWIYDEPMAVAFAPNWWTQYMVLKGLPLALPEPKGELVDTHPELTDHFSLEVPASWEDPRQGIPSGPVLPPGLARDFVLGVFAILLILLLALVLF
jgi:hypothetical protein